MYPMLTQRPHASHRSSRRAAGHRDAIPAEQPPDLAGAVDPRMGGMRSSDPLHHHQVPLGTRRGLGRIGPPGGMSVTGRWGDQQHPADRLHIVDLAVIVDEGEHGLNRRSLSAWVKYADALRRISSGWRSSRILHSKALIRSPSAPVGPGRRPRPRSAGLTRPRRASLVQPTLAATGPMAAHYEAWSPP